MTLQEKIAAIIDPAAFNQARSVWNWKDTKENWLKTVTKRRRICLAKADKILSLIAD